MHKLFVEELECRNLLNASGFGHEGLLRLDQSRMDTPTLMRSSSFGSEFNLSTRVERDLGEANGIVGHDFGTPYFGVGRESGTSFNDTYISREFGASPNSSISVAPEITFIFVFPESVSSVEINPDTASSLYVPASVPVPERSVDLANSPSDPTPIQVTPRTQNSATFELVPTGNANLIVQVEVPTLPKASSNLTELAALSTAANGSSTSAMTAEALASALSAKANASLSRADSLAGTTNLRGTPAGLAADAMAARGGSEIGADLAMPLVRPEPTQPLPQLSILAVPQVPSVQAIRASLGSLPQFADVMSGFSAVEFTSIEQGITKFLNRLEGTPNLAISQGEADLYPWIIAGVATMAACEMARRQLKKASARATASLLALSMTRWDVPHEHEHG
jgi:hypothetical protein